MLSLVLLLADIMYNNIHICLVFLHGILDTSHLHTHMASEGRLIHVLFFEILFYQPYIYPNSDKGKTRFEGSTQYNSVYRLLK